MAFGMVLDYLGVSAVRMLFLSAVVNGVLAPPLIVLVVLLTNDPHVMGRYRNSKILNSLGWVSAGAMTAAAVAMFVV